MLPKRSDILAQFQKCSDSVSLIESAANFLSEPLGESQAHTAETLARAKLSENFQSTFRNCLLKQMEENTQRQFHSILFQITSNAMSHGGWFRDLARALIDLTIRRDILGLSACLSFTERSLLEYCDHSDPFIRWCLLGYMRENPDDEKAWNEDTKILERLKEDLFPPVANYARYLLKYRELFLAVWSSKDEPKASEPRATQLSALREHRKSELLSFDRFAVKFFAVHPGDYERADIDRYLKLETFN